MGVHALHTRPTRVSWSSPSGVMAQTVLTLLLHTQALRPLVLVAGRYTEPGQDTAHRTRPVPTLPSQCRAHTQCRRKLATTHPQQSPGACVQSLHTSPVAYEAQGGCKLGLAAPPSVTFTAGQSRCAVMDRHWPLDSHHLDATSHVACHKSAIGGRHTHRGTQPLTRR